MIVIYHPDSYLNERKYIYDVVFLEWIGIPYHSAIGEQNEVRISLDDESKNIMISDIFFQTKTKDWLTIRSLPRQPLPFWHISQLGIQPLLQNDKIQIIYGCEIAGGNYLFFDNNNVKLGIDIFGSAFFMITRYEELVKLNRDRHARFSSAESLAYQEGFLCRPIINEYISILFWAIKKLWPRLEMKKRNFRVVPTHDVDIPAKNAFKSSYMNLREILGDFFIRRSSCKTADRIVNIYNTKIRNCWEAETACFERLMQLSENNGIKSCFYFMTKHTHPDYDQYYPLNHPFIENLIKAIRARGHEIGIHPSYTSNVRKENIIVEFNLLKKKCSDLGVQQQSYGGRQHYLRWSCPNTWQFYEDAGIVYDSSVGFADHIGFRCGVCYEYSVFNLKTRKKLKLIERPLSFMECSALSKEYMGVSLDKLGIMALQLKESVRKHQGDFVLLWHNSTFETEEDWEIYKEIIEG